MFQRPIVFIIGAGASAEAGLPTGPGLRGSISSLLQTELSFGQYEIVDDGIRDAVKRHISETLSARPGSAEHQTAFSQRYAEFAGVAKHIERSVTNATSIDTFLDSHREHPDITLCGKLAIGRAILLAEEKSHLYVSPPGGTSSDINFKAIDQTWYAWFMRTLVDGCDQRQVRNSIRNITFVIFNYDRCVEHFIFRALKTYYYGISDAEVADLMAAFTFIHPYGELGSLTFENGPTYIGIHPRERGGLLEISRGIRTYTEQISDGAISPKIGACLAAASVVVFLGFSYHPQNLRLLLQYSQKLPDFVLGTSYKLSAQNTREIELELASLFENRPFERDSIRRMQMRDEIVLSDDPCAKILEKYERRLRK